MKTSFISIFQRLTLLPVYDLVWNSDLSAKINLRYGERQIIDVELSVVGECDYRESLLRKTQDERLEAAPPARMDDVLHPFIAINLPSEAVVRIRSVIQRSSGESLFEG